MIYPYICICGETFDVVKPMAESQREENCPKCQAVAQRHWNAAPSIAVKSDFKADYYHALGKVIHNEKELKYELDKKNLVPVGNDFSSGHGMQEHFDKKRDYESKKKWENFDI